MTAHDEPSSCAGQSGRSLIGLAHHGSEYGRATGGANGVSDSQRPHVEERSPCHHDCSRIAHMRSDVVDIGQRVALARTRRGLTQADLAAAVGIDRSGLAKIENGTRKVAALELSAIAVELGERIEWFVTPMPQAMVSHRDGRGSETQNATIDLSLERIAREVEFVASLEASLISTVPEIHSRPKTTEDAEALAAAARALLGFSHDEPAWNLVDALSAVGLLSFSAKLGADTADAGTILLQKGGVSLVNSDNQVGRRRLALAHELGHYLVADDYTIDWRVSSHGHSQSIEALFDRFARALLLPSEALRSFWEAVSKSGDTREAALRTASHFRVDMSTLARRLQELAIAAPDVVDSLRVIQVRKADVIELDLHMPTDLEETSLPKSYQRAILRLYKRESISAARAVDLLLDTFEEASLPELPRRSEAEIWSATS